MHTLFDESIMAPVAQPQEVFRGYIRSTYDALLVFEAALSGRIPRVTRRFTDSEKRNDIKSGHCFVFGEEEAEIKRWTDGMQWSPSRIQKNFLIYRERYAPDEVRNEPRDKRDYESWLVGTLNNGEIKQDGLIKKTIGLTINGGNYHLVSYYHPQEVLAGQLTRPSELPDFHGTAIRNSILDCLVLREPLKYDIAPDGRTRIPIPDDDGPESPSRHVSPQSVSTSNASSPSGSPPASTSLPQRVLSASECTSIVPVTTQPALDLVQVLPQFLLAPPLQHTHTPTSTLVHPVSVFPHELLHLDGPPCESAQTPPTSAEINTLEFFPEGYGYIAATRIHQPLAATTTSSTSRNVQHSGSHEQSQQTGSQRRSKRTGSDRFVPYNSNINGRASRKSASDNIVMPSLEQSDQVDLIELYAHLSEHLHTVPVEQATHFPVPLQPPALIRTRSAPAPLDLARITGLFLPHHEPLSAASATSLMTDFEDAYTSYGLLTPHSVGGYDCFDFATQQQQQHATDMIMDKFVPQQQDDLGYHLGDGGLFQAQGFNPEAAEALIYDGMPQHLNLQGIWDGEFV